MKYKVFIALFAASIVVLSCRTTIPERDTRRPTFTFIIRGAGINETINQNFDFDTKAIYLKRGDTYTVSFIGSDAGGLQSMLWELQAAPPILDFPNPLPMGWISNVVGPGFNQIVWGGDRDNPINGYALTTELIANGATANSIEEIETLFVLLDYKGNEERKPLTLRIHNENPRIGTR